MKNLVIATIILTNLAACELDEPADDVSVIVTIIDEAGQPLTPDEAYWYWTPGSDDTQSEFELDCMDEDCTQFSVPIDVTGEFYVAATYTRDVENAEDCWYHGYDASPVTVNLPTDMSLWEPVKITLQLETDLMSCE